MRQLITALIAIAVWSPAWAYSPGAGDRANDIVGRDMQTNKVASLSGYQGKWVFIDFWATWCGPCMGELPNLIRETKDLRKAGNFEVFSVSLDFPTTCDEIRNVVRQQGITYPVIYDGGGWQAVQGVEWDIHSIPATFLVSPNGVIVATNLRGEKLRPMLDFFMSKGADYSPVGLNASHRLNADGSADITVLLTSPRHEPLKLDLDYAHYRYTWAEDDPEHKNRPVSSETIEQDAVKPEQSATVEFTQFGDASYSFHIPAVENTHRLSYYVTVQVPGTESMFDGEGFWLMKSGRVKLDEPAV